MIRIPFSPPVATGAVLLGLAVLTPARAHIGLEWQAALAGSNYKAVFKIGHGCGSSPTRQFVVEIPSGVRNPRPMPKPGWTVEVQLAAPTQPESAQGRSATGDVSRITWTARTREDMLDAAHYDEFVLVAGLPAAAGPMYWPVRQVCAQGRHDWVQVPQPGEKSTELQSPAPVLDILPAGSTGAHSH